MADLSKTIQIIFDGLDNTGDAISSVGKGIEGLAGSVEEATQPLADLTTSLLAIDAAAVAVGAALLKASVDAAGEFNTGMTEINTVVKLTGEELEKYSESVLEYGRNSTQSYADIEKALYAAVSAGVGYTDSLGLLAEAEKLAVAGNTDLEGSMTILVSTMNAYGKGIDDAGNLSDIFFKTVELGQVTVEDLNSNLGKIIPTAAGLGVPLEEIGTAMAIMTANGIGASEATTAIKATLDNIISPSKQAQEAAKALGLEWGAQALQTDGLVGTLNKMIEATDGDAAAMKTLFGSTEAYTGVLALTNDGGVKLNKTLEEMKNAAGATDTAYRQMAESLKFANQQLSNSIDEVLIRMGYEVIEEYTSLVKSFDALWTSLADALKAGSLDEPLQIMEDFLTELSRMVEEAAKALPAALAGVDWTEFEQAMAGLNESFGNLFGDIDLTEPEGLEKAIQALIDTASSFINITGGVIEGLKPLFAVIGEAIGWFNSLDPEVQETIGYLLGIGTTVNTVAGFIGAFGTAITGAGGMVASLSVLGPALVAVGAALAGFALGDWLAEVTGYDEAWDRTIGKFIDDLRGIPEVVKPSDDALAGMDANLAKVAETMGKSSLTMEEFNQAVADGAIKFDDATGTWKEAEQAFDDWGTTLGLASDSAIALAENMLKSGELSQAAFDTFMAGDKSLESLWVTMDATATKTGELGTAVKDVTSTAAYWGDALDAVKEKYDQGLLTQEEYAIAVKAIDDAAKGAGVELVTMADQQKDNAKSTKEMAEASEKFALEWEKLLSAERIAIFEASADIQVAQIEADAERAKAAMEMLSESFQSTGEVLTELIGLWAGLEGMDQQQITEWIEREYAIREQLAQAQIDLVQAEIARMEAQTRLLERGGVELTIQSDGLEPDLEAFMFKIIDRVRVAVAGSYEEFLLGCGT